MGGRELFIKRTAEEAQRAGATEGAGGARRLGGTEAVIPSRRASLPRFFESATLAGWERRKKELEEKGRQGRVWRHFIFILTEISSSSNSFPSNESKSTLSYIFIGFSKFLLCKYLRPLNLVMSFFT